MDLQGVTTLTPATLTYVILKALMFVISPQQNTSKGASLFFFLQGYKEPKKYIAAQGNVVFLDIFMHLLLCKV